MKILMVGLGGIGQRHLRNLRNILGPEVTFSAYRVRRLRQTLTDQLTLLEGVDLEEKYAIQVFTDLDEALQDKPNIVFVTNPTSEHIHIALAAARAGCDLFIEKPISHTYDQVQELIEIVNSQKLVAYVGYQNRFHPCLKLLHHLISENGIGQILAVNIEVGEYLPDWHVYEDYRQMYASRQELGGGVILSQIHEIDYTYWLFGMPKRVFALGGKLSSLEIDAEDMASMMLEFRQNGQILPIHIHADYLQRPPSRGCKVIGDKGKIIVDLQAASVYWYSADGGLAGREVFENFSRDDMFREELLDFLSCVKSRKQPSISIQDGAMSLKIALAAKKSIDTGDFIWVE
jgi:predicted dehydrogenase